MRKHRLYLFAIAVLVVVGIAATRPAAPSSASHPGASAPSSVTTILSAFAAPLGNDTITLAAASRHTSSTTTTTTTAVPDPSAGSSSTGTAASDAPAPAPAIPAPAAPAAIADPPQVVATPVSAPGPDVWAELRNCESGGNYGEDTGNGYYGAYQFSPGTWHGLGFDGLPSDAPPAVQDQAAHELQALSGWGQWPSCSAQLGL